MRRDPSIPIVQGTPDHTRPETHGNDRIRKKISEKKNASFWVPTCLFSHVFSMRGERLARERSSALLKWVRLRAASVLTGGSFILRYKRIEFGQFGISFQWWLVHFSVLPQRRSCRGRNGLCPSRAQVGHTSRAQGVNHEGRWPVP